MEIPTFALPNGTHCSKDRHIMKKKKTTYQPTSKYNPAYQSRQIEKLAERLRIHQLQIEAISRSHDNHITHLANFARHDIKNAIQNMDSILSTTSASDFNDKAIDSLSTCLDVIRTTLDNFAKLVPYSSTNTFTLDSLLVAVELLARADMQRNHIDMVFEYPRDTTIAIQLPFQAVLQMMNNLIINATKGLEDVSGKKLLLLAQVDTVHMTIAIKDNGTPIQIADSARIFEYGYSTTGGSGIGLFHAKYLCTAFKGDIQVDLQEDHGYNKTFIVKLPITLPLNGKDSTDH